MRPSQLLAAALAVFSVSASSLDAFDEVKAIQSVDNLLQKRQDNNNNNNDNENENQTTEPPTESPTPTSDETPTGEQNSETAEETGTSRPSRTQSNDDSETTDEPEFDARDPPGGVTMVTPAATLGQQAFKIGDWVTFGFNFTSLQSTPNAIDILATCTANNQMYTLAVNQSISDGVNMVLWDTNEYQATATVPLLTETYTLIIYDAESSISATARPGYLAVQNTYAFGMYVKQSYTPYSAGYRCPTCSSGSILSAAEKQTLGFLFTMFGMTILSFTYFGSGFGLW